MIKRCVAVISSMHELMLCCSLFQTVQACCQSHRDRMGPERREDRSRQQESSSLVCGGANKKNISIKEQVSKSQRMHCNCFRCSKQKCFIVHFVQFVTFTIFMENILNILFTKHKQKYTTTFIFFSPV